jgi:hypothetical protein
MRELFILAYCFFPCFSRLFPKQQVYASLIQEIHIHVQVKLPERKYIIITHLKHGGARTISDNTLSEEFGTKVALWAVGERGFLHTSWDCRITKASFCCGRAVRFPRPPIRAYLKDHGPWLPRSQYPTDTCYSWPRVQQSRSPIVWKQTHQNSGRQSHPSKSDINNSITCCIDVYCFHQFSISIL